MTKNVNSNKPVRGGGIRAFIADVERCAANCGPGRDETNRFVRRIGERYAFIRLDDMGKPVRFLKQMAGRPPIQFGAEGFKPSLVDDHNPARHYTAFVFVGYWFPPLLAFPIMYGWEILGFLRYRGHWSQADVRMGHVGLRHGRQVRQEGPHVLADLIRRDLTV